MKTLQKATPDPKDLVEEKQDCLLDPNSMRCQNSEEIF
jgi:hypothetical protein